MAASALVTGGLVASRATRDALFLTFFPATAIPAVTIAAALLSLVGAAGLSRWVSRSGPARAVPLAVAMNGVVFLAEWALLGRAPRSAAAALYLHVTAIGPLLVSGFWSVVSERFDPHTAKRSVPRMAAAGALAGVAGGVAAERVAALADIGWTLGLLAAIALAAAAAVRGVGAPEEEGQTHGPSAAAPGTPTPAAVIRHPLLATMALLMVLDAAVGTFLDYALKLEAAAAWPETQQLVRFFAAFYVGCGLLTFAFQAGVGSWVLRRFGLGIAMGILPVGVMAGGSLALFSSGLWSLVVVRGLESVLANGVFRSGFELLYAPVPPALKRYAKAWIDVSSRSVGAMLGAAIVLFLLFVAPGLGTGAPLALAVATAGFALAGVIRSHRAYVVQLGSRLRSGRLTLRPEDLDDATTARTVAESRVGMDRRALLQQVRAFAETRSESSAAMAEGAVLPAPSALPPSAAHAADGAAVDPDPMLARILELCSEDPVRVRRALYARDESAVVASGSVDRRVTPHVIPLLAHPTLARDAEVFVRRVAPRSIGQLVDSLLDRTERQDVRMALARILSDMPDRRALEGLWLALDDPAFELRRVCAEAAARLVARRKMLAPPKEVVHARLERELRAAAVPEGADPARLLEHVFTLLALVHGRETMRSTLSGVRSGSPTLRGTAFELLESVLPPGLSRRVLDLVRESEC